MADCDLWPVPAAGVCNGGCTIPADVDVDLLEQASIMAGAILHTLSGRQVGQCSDTIRPVGVCPVCTQPDCCGVADRVRLTSGLGVVTNVTQVVLDGVTLDASEWRFYASGRLLYRVPPGSWPSVDAHWLDCGQPGTLCVDVLIGNPPDAWALAVHRELTCELLASCMGVKCRIPRNATQVTSQGISVTLSGQEFKTFIPSVAGWVDAINPAGVLRPPAVFSPDLDPQSAQARRTSWLPFRGGCCG